MVVWWCGSGMESGCLEIGGSENAEGRRQTDREKQRQSQHALAPHTQLAPSANKPQPSLFPASERRPARGAPAKFQGGAVLLPTSSSFIPACRCPLRMGEHTTAPPLSAPETAVSFSQPIKSLTALPLVGGSVLVPPTHEDFLTQASARRRHVNPLLFQPWSNRLPSLHALPPSPAPIITKAISNLHRSAFPLHRWASLLCLTGRR